MTQTLSRLTWVHEDGQQLCIAEPGRPIRAEMDRDPYDAGVVDRIARTETGDRLPADALEQAYGKFESELAPILQSAGSGNVDLSKEEFDTILNLVTLLAIRNPRHRSRFGEFQDQARQIMLDILTATKER
jgi:hypothetical protein